MRVSKRVEKYAECGSLGHAWDDVDSSSWNPQWGNPVTFRCMRCGGERREIWDRRGDMSQRHYKMPDDYSYPKGQRPTRADFRRALVIKKRRKQRQDDNNIVELQRKKRA